MYMKTFEACFNNLLQSYITHCACADKLCCDLCKIAHLKLVKKGFETRMQLQNIK